MPMILARFWSDLITVHSVMGFAPFCGHGDRLHILVYTLGLTAYEIVQRVFFKVLQVCMKLILGENISIKRV